MDVCVPQLYDLHIPTVFLVVANIGFIMFAMN